MTDDEAVAVYQRRMTRPNEPPTISPSCLKRLWPWPRTSDGGRGRTSRLTPEAVLRRRYRREETSWWARQFERGVAQRG
jgi:hypothetical protein